MRINLTVFGRAAPAGSKKAVPMGKRWGVVDDSKRSKPWKDQVAQQAGLAMAGRDLIREPVHVQFTFFVRRPKGHMGTGRNAGKVRPSAPQYPAKKPDVLKLARAVEDALTGVVYNDDAQIVSEYLEKQYGEPERVEIAVQPMNGGRDA